MIDTPVTLYEYQAVIVSVYDGDTVRADIDLGFSMFRNNESLRLFGLDTPEMVGGERELGLTDRRDPPWPGHTRQVWPLSGDDLGR